LSFVTLTPSSFASAAAFSPCFTVASRASPQTSLLQIRAQQNPAELSRAQNCQFLVESFCAMVKYCF